MAGATAQELAVRTAIATVADTGTLLQKVDSPGRLYAPITKAQLKIDIEVKDEFIELIDTPDEYASADIGKVLRVKDDLSGLEFTDSLTLATLTVGSLSGIIKGTDGVLSAITDDSANWNTAYDHSQIAGGDSVHVSVAENTAWDTAYSHSQLASGNPHNVTPTELSLVIGTDVQAHGAVLDDLNILGANAADNEVLIGTAAGVLAWEKDSTLRTSLGLGTGNSPEFTAITLSQGTINNAPSVNTGIATKGYVDSLGGGGSTFWTSVSVATTENIDLDNDLEAGDVIDSWTLVAGDRVLVKDQTDGTENGLYVAVASGAASRADDADTADEIVSRKCIILHGDTYEDQLFFCATSEIEIGVTDIEFNSLAGGGSYGVVELLGEEYVVGGEWVSPLSVTDVISKWDDENNSIDEEIGTFARHTCYQYQFTAALEFAVLDCACDRIRISAKTSQVTQVRGHYFDGSWHTVGYVNLTSSQEWHEISFGGIRNITKFKLDFNAANIGSYTYLYEVEYENLTSTAQHKITLAAGTPTSDFTITFPDTDGETNQTMLSDGSGILSWGGHDDLFGFVSGEHFLQTAITNVSTALSTGLLKVTTGSGELSVITDSSSNWNTAYGWGNHAGLYDAAGTAASSMSTHESTYVHADIAMSKSHTDTTHDYSYISGNDGATDISAAELEELSNGSETTLHSHAGGGGAETFLDLEDTPNSYDSEDIGKYVKVKDDLSGLEFDTPAGGDVSTWIDLTDTDPVNYTGQAGNTVVVNAGEDGLEFGAAPGGSFTSKCSVYRSATQTITTGVSTKIQFDTEDYDIDSEFDSITNHRFQPDVAGYYHISAGVNMLLGIADRVNAMIYKNGVLWKLSMSTVAYATSAYPAISCDMYLLSTDYIEIYINHQYGSDRDTGGLGRRTFLDVHRFA